MMRFPFLLPVWIVLADMIYTFVLNVMQSVASGQKKALPADGLPVSPDIVFSGLQVVANGSMVLCIGFGLLMLLRLDRSVARGKAMPVGVFATLGLLAVLAFSLASVWQWGWALLRLSSGHIVRQPALSAGCRLPALHRPILPLPPLRLVPFGKTRAACRAWRRQRYGFDRHKPK